LSDDDLTVDRDVDLETRVPTAEEMRAARRARLEDFVEYIDFRLGGSGTFAHLFCSQWAQQQKAELLATHAPVSASEPLR
jgi:hypothetical protein